LAAATYKLLGVKRDTEHKQKMRDLILSCPEDFLDEEKKSIMEYCAEDVEYLPKLFQRMKEEYSLLIPKKERGSFQKEMLLRGDYAARTAIMVTSGYPVNVDWMQSFSDSTKDIQQEVQEEINQLFPTIQPFEFDKKTGFYVQKRKKISNWIGEYCKETRTQWALTPTKDFDQSLEEWESHFSFRHDFPKDNFAAQIIRLGRLNQSLNGFKPAKETTKETIWDKLGSDGRVRAFTGIYGAQSARSQQSSTSFIPLKAAWMRALIQPPPGYAIGAFDWKSEEFLIAGLNSGDKNMLESYKSGDVYFHFAKLAGAVPMKAKREDYEAIRDRFKSTTLGIQYIMGAESLARKLSMDTGVQTSEDEAQELIDMFNEAYQDYFHYKNEIIQEYKENGYLKLFDGWYMLGDNPNFRSIANVPIQGMGSVIMREAVRRAQNSNLTVIFTLHDAIYILSSTSEIFNVMAVLADCMRLAFKWPYLGTKVEKEANAGIDGKIWSNDFEDKEETITIAGAEVKKQKIYVDKRSISDYKKFEKYFYRKGLMDIL
jgi:hypothetical protein